MTKLEIELSNETINLLNELLVDANKYMIHSFEEMGLKDSPPILNESKIISALIMKRHDEVFPK